LMVHALKNAVHDGDIEAGKDIIHFCKTRRVLLHVTIEELDLLITKRDYEMMKLLIKNFVYY